MHCGGVVVGRASPCCWGDRQHIREILSEFGEEIDIIGCGLLDGFVDSRSPLIGHVWEDASLLQSEQVVRATIWLSGRIPAHDDSGGAKDLIRQVGDRAVWH